MWFLVLVTMTMTPLEKGVTDIRLRHDTVGVGFATQSLCEQAGSVFVQNQKINSTMVNVTAKCVNSGG